MNKILKKILLAGGGTGGSVTPLLAVVEELSIDSSQLYNFLWLGTRTGVEREMVDKLNISFKSILNGKLRRYLSWRNFIDPLFIAIGFLQGLYIVWKWKPDLVMCAGSFVGVPVVWASWVLRVPVLIHQQDARPSLANRLMAPFAKVITVTFEKSLKDYGKKAVWTGNPVRRSLTDGSKQTTDDRFDFKKDLPVLLIIGGGTGALAINNIVVKSLSELSKISQIIHITGKGKIIGQVSGMDNYHYYDFLDSDTMAAVYRTADVVVSRCGMNVLTELAYLGKPVILIPIPNSHQEDNALLFFRAKAAIVLDQEELNSEIFIRHVRRLFDDDELRQRLERNIKTVIKKDANKAIIKIIDTILYEKL